jgi:TRAP-type C4-dicarboxylate transport system substrate-binding protein
MKLLKSLVTAVAITLGLSAVFNAAAQSPVTLRVHTYLPAGAPVVKDFFVPWGEKVMKESKGQLKVEIYPSMQLGGSPTSLFDQAKDGLADIVLVPLLYTPNRFPKSEVFELPFELGGAEVTSRAAWDYYTKHMRDEMREVHVIALNTHGPGAFHKRGSSPITKLEDLKGLKIRGPNRTVNELLKNYGATPVSVPGAGISEALSKGVIDVGTFPWEAVPALKIHELTESHSTFSGKRGLYAALFVTVMNKQKYDSLSPALKKVVDDNSGMETGAWIGRVMEKADAPGMEVARKRGNKIHVISEAETKRWVDASQPVIQDWVQHMKRRGIDGTVLLNDLRTSLVKYETK